MEHNVVQLRGIPVCSRIRMLNKMYWLFTRLDKTTGAKNNSRDRVIDVGVARRNVNDGHNSLDQTHM